MKYLGIDYGTKKVGLAVSDDMGMIAFPKKIVELNKSFIEKIKQYIEEWGIEAIVVGKSLSLDGRENTLQQKIQALVNQLEKETALRVYLEDERLSSVAARSHLYGKGNIANEQWSGKKNQQRRDPIDAGAAAVILQRYLDKKKNHMN